MILLICSGIFLLLSMILFICKVYWHFTQTIKDQVFEIHKVLNKQIDNEILILREVLAMRNSDCVIPSKGSNLCNKAVISQAYNFLKSTKSGIDFTNTILDFISLDDNRDIRVDIIRDPLNHEATKYRLCIKDYDSVNGYVCIMHNLKSIFRDSFLIHKEIELFFNDTLNGKVFYKTNNKSNHKTLFEKIVPEIHSYLEQFNGEIILKAGIKPYDFYNTVTSHVLLPVFNIFLVTISLNIIFLCFLQQLLRRNSNMSQAAKALSMYQDLLCNIRTQILSRYKDIEKNGVVIAIYGIRHNIPFESKCITEMLEILHSVLKFEGISLTYNIDVKIEKLLVDVLLLKQILLSIVCFSMRDLYKRNINIDITCNHNQHLKTINIELTDDSMCITKKKLANQILPQDIIFTAEELEALLQIYNGVFSHHRKTYGGNRILITMTLSHRHLIVVNNVVKLHV